MSSNEKEYPTYLQYVSSSISVFSLFSGFTFTTITILLTLLPDPSHLLLQVTLFFLTFMLDIFLFSLFFAVVYSGYCLKDAPPEMKGRAIIQRLSSLCFSLWGIVIVLMFIHWNLVYLALASAAVYALFAILGFIYIVKPSTELGRRLRSQK